VQGDFASATLKVTGPSTSDGIHNLIVKAISDAVADRRLERNRHWHQRDRWIGGSSRPSRLLSLKVNGDKARKKPAIFSGVNINLSDPTAKLLKVECRRVGSTTQDRDFGNIGTSPPSASTLAHHRGSGKTLDKLTVEGKTTGQNFFAVRT